MACTGANCADIVEKFSFKDRGISYWYTDSFFTLISCYIRMMLSWIKFPTLSSINFLFELALQAIYVTIIDSLILENISTANFVKDGNYIFISSVFNSMSAFVGYLMPKKTGLNSICATRIISFGKFGWVWF